ncbi:hypothetical protein OPV22_019148 [Ensete ventricosum]|uniref:Uncharacterized protein n=1 Tax=Ensete ventricosum TaxID=4639 RepID=A0AAV8R659_ENSVE|nr:hypothetical protein OPV22_019148 [Ensete ventricosum]
MQWGYHEAVLGQGNHGFGGGFCVQRRRTSWEKKVHGCAGPPTCLHPKSKPLSGPASIRMVNHGPSGDCSYKEIFVFFAATVISVDFTIITSPSFSPSASIIHDRPIHVPCTPYLGVRLDRTTTPKLSRSQHHLIYRMQFPNHHEVGKHPTFSCVVQSVHRRLWFL